MKDSRSLAQVFWIGLLLGVVAWVVVFFLILSVTNCLTPLIYKYETVPAVKSWQIHEDTAPKQNNKEA